MDALGKFDSLMRDFLRPELKKHGFTLKGRTFSWFDRGNWGLIEIQKGSTSTPDVLVFTINVGVASRRFSGLSDEQWRKTRPPMYRADYNLRLGFLLGLPAGHKDKWWTLNRQLTYPISPKSC
jgi:hypothetical protein